MFKKGDPVYDVIMGLFGYIDRVYTFGENRNYAFRIVGRMDVWSATPKELRRCAMSFGGRVRVQKE